MSYISKEVGMPLKKGDRVRHPTKADWGLGELLEDSNGETARVFFVGGGEKSISLKYVALDPVPADDAQHPVLDNLRVPSPDGGVRYRTLSRSKERFLELFPEGFYGTRFMTEERDYKVRAHELAKELLDQNSLLGLLSAGDHGEVCRRALRVCNATNLIFPNEKMALKDGLESPEHKEAFSTALFALLHGEEGLESRFNAYAEVLESIGAAKWTTATYFLFIVHPDEYMFLKPMITQNAAEICGFEINYRPGLNWLTFASVQKFANYLKSELIDLKPRDMIDVQSFMWCIAPDKR